MPHEVDGGGNTPDGRINLDGGILNEDLFERLGPEASDAYARARLWDRIDAGIAHEFEEAKGGAATNMPTNTPEDGAAHPIRVRELARKIRDADAGMRLINPFLPAFPARDE